MPPVVGAIAGAAAIAGVSSSTLVIGIASVGAKIGLSYIEQRKAKRAARRQSASQDIQQNIRQPVVPTYVVLGKRRIGGAEIFRGTKNGTLYTATALSSGIIESVQNYYIGDIECAIDAQGNVTTAPYSSTLGNKVQIELHYGYTDQAASPMLMAAFPGVWTADHRCRGIAYMVTAMQSPANADDFQAIYNSTVPDRAALVRGALVYDPRDVTQNYAVEATWKFSTNPALLLLHFFTSTQGCNLPRSLFDGNSYTRAANYCDELIPDKDGVMRKRYEAGGSYSSDFEPADIAEMLLDSFGGEPYITQIGLFGVAVDGLDAATVTLTADNIVAMKAQHATGALYEYSSVKSTFSSEDHGYKEGIQEAKPWIDAAAVTAIGRDIPYAFDLPFVFRHDQARRLMKREYYRLNPQWSLQFETDFEGIQLYGERVFNFQFPALGIDGLFRIEQVEPHSDLGFARMIVKAVSVDAAAYAWNAATEEGDAPPVPPETEETGIPLQPTNLAVLASTSPPDVALVSWDALTTGKTQTFEWKTTAGSTWTAIAVTPTQRAVRLPALTPATSYDVRVRVNSVKYGSSGYATASFTPPGSAGVTGALQSLSATGGVGKLYVSAQQSAAVKAAAIQVCVVASGAPADWTSPTSFDVQADASIASKEIAKAAGSYYVYARSVGINGDFGADSGPVAVTVTAQVVNGGSSGSGVGTGGNGSNDGGGTLNHDQTIGSWSSNSYDGAMGGSGSGGSSGGGGGLY